MDALIDAVSEKQPQSYEQVQRLIVSATVFVQRSNMLTPEQRSNVFQCVNNTVFCRYVGRLKVRHGSKRIASAIEHAFEQWPATSAATMAHTPASVSTHSSQWSVSQYMLLCSLQLSCRVCFKLREQLPPGGHFVCCPKCLWGWCCQEHWQQFKPQHQPSCAEYATMRRLGVQLRQQASAGFSQHCNQLPYPMGKVAGLQQRQCLQDWARYRRYRVPSITNEDTWR